jgi:hypothetical protein
MGNGHLVDLLVLTSLDQLIFVLKCLIIFVTKQSPFMRRSTVLSLSLQLVFRGPRHSFIEISGRYNLS